MHNHPARRTRHFYYTSFLIALTYIVRLWGLTASSLWYDEIFVLTHAKNGLIEALTGLLIEDNALPLHGLLTTLWIHIAGSGEFSARYLSVLLGTVTTPFILKFSQALTRTKDGTYGSGLVYATLPVFVYYTQEVRMYALVMPLAALFAWQSLRLVRQGKNSWLYVVSGFLMLTAHLYSGLLWAVVLIWGGLGLLLPAARGLQPRNPYKWVRANATLFVCSIPIAVWAFWRVQADATATSAIPYDVLRWIPVAFGIRQYISEPWSVLFTLFTAFLMCMGIIKLLRIQQSDSALYLVLTLIVPVLLLLGATIVKAKWNERYLLPSFGLGLIVSAGMGLDTYGAKKIHLGHHLSRYRISRTRSVLFVMVWIASVFPALERQATGNYALAIKDEWHPRPDFRGVATYIEREDGPEDLIVVVAGHAAHTLAYYYEGPAKLTGLPQDTRVLNTNQILDLTALQILEHEISDYRTLWLVLWQRHLIDPMNIIESTLVTSCKRLPVETSFTNIGVLRFDLTRCAPLAETIYPAHPLSITFESPIHLRGYNLQKQEGLWEVDLWWKSTGHMDDNYTVFVHLVNPAGEIVEQDDHIAGADAYPTSQWREGTTILNRFYLAVPEDGCPQCSLQVGLYTSKERLNLKNGGDTITINIDH